MSEQNTELLPCPFCGGEADIMIVPGFFEQGLSSDGWFVTCKKCKVHQKPHVSDHDAMDAWNQRETLEPEGQWKYIGMAQNDFAYRCSFCRYESIGMHPAHCPNCDAKMKKEILPMGR